ncbi:MAG TPA: hybrid sensor histidine kinase/response regulator [Caldithrix abyssi]|uniref:histidine kinase n=1 Tax=Caldithrix abyssi TaxID=187145 RepID=A0A7V1PVP2_CALAY|nr:hybrid sensor histidine kinase/response regulator [Caldithrix abyssi]
MDFKDISLLVIEDEELVRESYVDMFELFGFQIDDAANGQLGLQKLAQKDYDIVITDLNMPVMDGLETLKRIKKKNIQTEVIVITGFATIENAITAMKEGAFDYITKPISLEHARIVLTRCVQHIEAVHENEALRNVNARLRQVNELKDKFITITNHEMRTPLAVIKGYMELLDLSLENKNAETEEYIGIVNNTLGELIELVERMHNLSEAEASGNRYKPQLFNIVESIIEVASGMKLLFQKRGIHFSVYSNEKNIPVLSDENGIRRMVRELLQNALKFTEEDGRVTLRIRKEKAEGKVYIKVEDTGVGIPADQLKIIFEPFYEVQDVMHHSTSQTDFMGGGIGVGLSIVREIVEGARGEIAVESTPGQGSIFTVILPCSQETIPV